MKATKDQKPVHFFASSCVNWNTDDNLPKLLARQKKLDKASGYGPKNFGLWRVPGVNKETNYHIDNYEPQAEGAEFIGLFTYD